MSHSPGRESNGDHVPDSDVATLGGEIRASQGLGNGDLDKDSTRSSSGSEDERRKEDEADTNYSEFADFVEPPIVRQTLQGDGNDEDLGTMDELAAASDVRAQSPEDSASIPDDTPSLKGSVRSSPRSGLSRRGSSVLRRSPNASLRPFDRRFQSRLTSSPLVSPRTQSPAFLDNFSRRSSLDTRMLIDKGDTESLEAPWEVIRWIKLKKIAAQSLSERGKRSFGHPTCLAVSSFIALGTSKGIILVFDYNQDLRSVIGPGTEAVESGSVLSLTSSADQAVIAGGYANGAIFTWELARPAKPFMRIPPLSFGAAQNRIGDGHVPNVGVLHLSFLGARRTALASADGRGMAFSHLATRGLGAVNRAISTTRILGRYPDDVTSGERSRKPSAVLAFSALPLGNVEQSTDTMGLVAMLTPYLLVIVSTIPVAQTQHKSGRPKEIAAHGALSGVLAWFPAVRLKGTGDAASEIESRTKLVYCWWDVLTVVELMEVDTGDSANPDRPPVLSFRARSRWKANESIVAVQWLSRSLIAVLTITQRLVILEDHAMTVNATIDLMNRQILHHDLFSKNLQSLVERLDDDLDSMHGVVADAFFTSFRVYKGRIFLLGINDVSAGILSNWADRLTALVDGDRFVEAIRLATDYFLGNLDALTVGLPSDVTARRLLIEEKLVDILSTSLNGAFQMQSNGDQSKSDVVGLQEISSASFAACIAMNRLDFLFDEVYDMFEQHSRQSLFFQSLGHCILDDEIHSIPPPMVKGLADQYLAQDSGSQLEEIICRLDPSTMDADFITNLCKQYRLYDALAYVWNQAFEDYITPLTELMSILMSSPNDDDSTFEKSASVESLSIVCASKIFPYLSYILTGKVYPAGDAMAEERAWEARSQLYSFLFSGTTFRWPESGGKPISTQRHGESEPSFPYLRLLLNFDAPSLLSALNEAFEDPFLNGTPDIQTDTMAVTTPSRNSTSAQKMNRQHIISILWEVMYSGEFDSEQTIYLDMFVARNLAKFPQFIVLPGVSLHRVLTGLCDYPSSEIAEDCQLSVEYLLSVYHPPDLDSLIPNFKQAGFYRVLKSIYRANRQYGKLLQSYFDDTQGQDEVFFCLEECLHQRTGIKERKWQEIQNVAIRHAGDLMSLNTTRTAEIVDRYASEWHNAFLEAAQNSPHSQFIYLRTILEPRLASSSEILSAEKRPSQQFVELYARLMCKYDPAHVADYIEVLRSGDLRLEQVLPEMESEGVVDAAIVLVAREGRVRDAMTRLLKHLGSLEAALLGLLQSWSDHKASPEMEEAVQETLEALQKYSRVGIWLCQRQMKSMQMVGLQSKPPSSVSSSVEGDLSLEETLWLELIDSTVRIVKNVTALLPAPDEQDSSQLETLSSQSRLNTWEVTKVLRGMVQQTFTVLLESTTSRLNSREQDSGRQAAKMASSVSSSSSSRRLDLSFLRILRAFLARATVTSASLSELRAVLSSIFSAYAYEESLLSISNKLLQDDLFVHVTEVTQRRQRGWKPRSQRCEGCGRRAWGPGAGSKVWEAWRMKSAIRRRDHAWQVDPLNLTMDQRRPPGKVEPLDAREDKDMLTTQEQSERSLESDRLDELLIFSCQHVFHRSCLQRLSPEAVIGSKDDRHRHHPDSSSKGPSADVRDLARLRAQGDDDEGSNGVGSLSIDDNAKSIDPRLRCIICAH